jgi:hypothetical protein
MKNEKEMLRKNVQIHRPKGAAPKSFLFLGCRMAYIAPSLVTGHNTPAAVKTAPKRPNA